MVQRLRRQPTVRPEQDQSEAADEAFGLWSRAAVQRMDRKFVEQVERALRQERQGKVDD
jgi:hypothetical protein